MNGEWVYFPLIRQMNMLTKRSASVARHTRAFRLQRREAVDFVVIA
jgi:hypothetical protein